MKRDRDEFEADHHREPSWVGVLVHCNVMLDPDWFDDPSQEWDCASPEEARCRMLPLGFMVGTSMIREAEKFPVCGLTIIHTRHWNGQCDRVR